MLRHPALFSAEVRGDSQSEAFFALQNIAPVVRVHRNDFIRLRKLDYVLVLRIQIALAVDAPDEIVPVADGIENRLADAGHEDAAPAPAVGIVVHLHLLVFGEIPDLHAVDVEDAFFAGPPEDALVQHGVHRVGKKGHDVDAHCFTFLR